MNRFYYCSVAPLFRRLAILVDFILRTAAQVTFLHSLPKRLDIRDMGPLSLRGRPLGLPGS